jgi:hypothetical protein
VFRECSGADHASRNASDIRQENSTEEGSGAGEATTAGEFDARVVVYDPG